MLLSFSVFLQWGSFACTSDSTSGALDSHVGCLSKEPPSYCPISVKLEIAVQCRQGTLVSLLCNFSKSTL